MQKAFYRSLTLLFFVTLLTVNTSCSKDEDPVSSTNPYKGTWSLAFAGSYIGAGQMNVGNDGGFSLNVILTGSGQTVTNTVSGTISSSGQLQNGKIFYAGTQIGTVNGNFQGSAGSGTYQTSATSGTWSATKN